MCGVSGALMGLTALSGYNQYRTQQAQYKAQAAAYDAQAQAAEQNARIADRQREQVADNYAAKQKQLDDKRRLIIGQQAAAAGAAGLTGGGSVLDANSAAIDQYRTDSTNLLWNQRNDALSAWANQVNYINQGRQARAAAANTRSQAKSARLSSLIDTAVGLYGVYSTYGNPFASKASSAGPGMQLTSGATGSLEAGNLGYTMPQSINQSWTKAVSNNLNSVAASVTPNLSSVSNAWTRQGLSTWSPSRLGANSMYRYKYPWGR